MASVNAAAARLEERRRNAVAAPHVHGPSCTTACLHYQPLDLWYHPGFCPRAMPKDPKARPSECEGHALERPEDLRERSAAARAGRHVADD